MARLIRWPFAVVCDEMPARGCGAVPVAGRGPRNSGMPWAVSDFGDPLRSKSNALGRVGPPVNAKLHTRIKAEEVRCSCLALG